MYFFITLYKIHKKRIFVIQFLQPTNLDEKLTALHWKMAVLVCPFPPFSTSQLTTIFILVVSRYKTGQTVSRCNPPNLWWHCLSNFQNRTFSKVLTPSAPRHLWPYLADTCLLISSFLTHLWTDCLTYLPCHSLIPLNTCQLPHPSFITLAPTLSLYATQSSQMWHWKFICISWCYVSNPSQWS